MRLPPSHNPTIATNVGARACVCPCSPLLLPVPAWVRAWEYGSGMSRGHQQDLTWNNAEMLPGERILWTQPYCIPQLPYHNSMLHVLPRFLQLSVFPRPCLKWPSRCPAANRVHAHTHICGAAAGLRQPIMMWLPVYRSYMYAGVGAVQKQKKLINTLRGDLS